MRYDIEKLLKGSGAVLKRTKSHRVWELPNGRIFVEAKTSGDFRAIRNNYRYLQRLLEDKPARGGEDER